MFFKKEDIKAKIKGIILDERDNDIVFILAAKGMGKINLLSEIYDSESANEDIIIADGKRVRNASSCLSKCYIDGIFKYIEKDNTRETKKRFIQQLPKKKISMKRRIAFLQSIEKIGISEFSLWLSDLSPRELKEIYISVAGETPLVIIASAIWLEQIDVKYLQSLYADEWGARITYIIALRPTRNSIHMLKNIIEKNTPSVWIFPILPEIGEISEPLSPRTLAPIVVNNIGSSEYRHGFQDALKTDGAYFEIYSAVHDSLHHHLNVVDVCLMTNEDMANEVYLDLQKITKILYPNTKIGYDKWLILPYDNRLLWIDSLAYYIALYEGIDHAIVAIQQFFFDIATCADRLCQDATTQHSIIIFLRNCKKQNLNHLAVGLPAYYSSFAKFTMNFFPKKQFRSKLKNNTLMTLELFDCAVLEFSDDNIISNVRLLIRLYEESQLCDFLDICLETVTRFFEKHRYPYLPEQTVIESVSELQTLCASTAYQRSDITLLDGLVNLQKTIQIAGCSIKIDYKGLHNSEKKALLDYFIKRLENENLKLEDVIMKKTIFLSYAHADKNIAKRIDSMLSELGYDVYRDEKKVDKWDDLQAYMKSIRKQDYALFLISDNFLHSINCLYEIMQFMKDENYRDRCLPIAIDFSKAEKDLRRSQNKTINMFDTYYWIDIVQYWEEYAVDLDKKLKGIKRENAGEFDLKYRMINGLPQTVSEFFANSFNYKNLVTIDPEKMNIKKVVNHIDNIISERTVIDKT